MKKLILFLAILFSLAFARFAYADYPNYQGYVNDFAHVLSQSFVTSLDQQLQQFDQQTTDQIAVVTIDTVGSDTIENYSIHLADKWKVGQKGKDNGIIMLFAMKDRQMRIEVGRGLEGDLTDIQAKHIETDVIAPEFKQGQYEAGIQDGVNSVIATITHSATLSASPVPSGSTSTDSTGLVIFIFVVVLIIILFLAFSPWTKLGGKGVWGVPMMWGEFGNDDDNHGSGFGGFGGGGFSGGGASSSW